MAIRADMSVIPGGITGFQAAIGGHLPYEVQSAEDEDSFYSAGSACQIGNLLLSRIYASAAYSGFRAPARRDDPRHSYVLLLKEFGGSVSLQSRRSCTLQPGQMSLLNSNSPLESQQHDSGASLMISIPAHALAAHYANVDDWCLVPLDPTSGAATVLRECILCFWRAHGDIGGVEAPSLLASLIHLIGAAYKGHDQLPHFESYASKMHFLRIRQIVADNLESPDLSTDFVANHLGISKSYLFEIMRAAKTTLGRFVLASRLDRCRELLADPTMDGRSISDIAFSVGFQELSHFSRTFSERFRCAPRDFRAASRRAVG